MFFVHGAFRVYPFGENSILVLFLSMTALSVFLDEIGFFRYLAGAAIRFAGEKQTVLFYVLYALVSVLTVFTSNDVIILTFTPFICYFTRCAGIDPLPYLVSEFVAANTLRRQMRAVRTDLRDLPEKDIQNAGQHDTDLFMLLRSVRLRPHHAAQHHVDRLRVTAASDLRRRLFPDP